MSPRSDWIFPPGTMATDVICWFRGSYPVGDLNPNSSGDPHWVGPLQNLSTLHLRHLLQALATNAQARFNAEKQRPTRLEFSCIFPISLLEPLEGLVGRNETDRDLGRVVVVSH